MAKVVIISSVTSEHSRLNGIKNEVTSYLTDERLNYDQIKILDLPPEDLIYGNGQSKEIIEANEKVKEAEAVIILTPVYKASFTGVLKTFLDLIPQKGFADKIILPLLIGGTYGHLLVKDVALKPVCIALGATTILNGVFALDSQIQRVRNKQFEIDQHLQERLRQELEKLTLILKQKVYV